MSSWWSTRPAKVFLRRTHVPTPLRKKSCLEMGRCLSKKLTVYLSGFLIFSSVILYDLESTLTGWSAWRAMKLFQMTLHSAATSHEGSFFSFQTASTKRRFSVAYSFSRKERKWSLPEGSRRSSQPRKKIENSQKDFFHSNFNEFKAMFLAGRFSSICKLDSYSQIL